MTIKKNNVASKVISFALVMIMMLGILIQAFAADNKYLTPTFTDVPKNHWAYTFTEQAAEKGWVTGVGNGKFMPDGQVTYAQLVTMLGQAFFKSDVDSYTGVTTPWFAKFCNVANQNGLFNGTNAQNHVLDEQYVGVSVNRYEMAQVLYNVMKAKGLNVTVDQTAAKASTADWNSIPIKYRDAVAVCKAAGVINGIDSDGTFGGNGKMTRTQACVVLIQLDKYIANGGSSGNQGSQGGNQGNQSSTNYGPVGTMSDFKVTLSLDTHKPIHDYWSQQSAEIRNLTDKDAFNAAVQSMKDAGMIMTEGAFGTSGSSRKINLYYNYAMYENRTSDGAATVRNALNGMLGHAYGNYGYVLSSVNNMFCPIKVDFRNPTADEMAKIFAPIFARFPANATDKQKVEICMQEIVNRFDYKTGTSGFTWLNGNTEGNCESYANATSQILAAAGIPNMQVKGSTSYGAHAWVQAYIDGQWMIVDGTTSESCGVGAEGVMSFAEYKQIAGVSDLVNNTDEIKVARALVEASLS